MSRRRQPTIYPPSVGELMDRANVLARELLYDAPERDGRAMLRAWGEVVEGASGLWHQLPRKSDFPGTGREVIDQLERSARTLHRSAGGAMEVDPTLQEIGQNFAQAAELIARSGVAERREPNRWTDAQLRDSWAARVNIMHTVYLASHAVSVGLAENDRAERVDARLRVHNVSGAELQRRVLDVEQVAHSYINGYYPQALAGRHREPVDDTRISSAVSSWDVHVQRALARQPTPDAMARVAASAFAASTHVHRLWRTAVEAGHVDRRDFDAEIAPRLETMIEKWGAAHDLLQRLTHLHDNSPAPLRDAAAELNSAMREVTTGPQGPVPIEDVRQRVDMPSLVRSLHRFHATVAGVAGAFHETARTASLSVDARAANDLIKTTLDQDERRSPPQDQTTVAPKDILQKRAIPIPPDIRGRVEEIGREVVSAARGSLRATLSASDQRDSEPVVSSRRTPAAERLPQSQVMERRQLSTALDDPGPGPRR